jgi:hypothetical protein
MEKAVDESMAELTSAADFARQSIEQLRLYGHNNSDSSASSSGSSKKAFTLSPDPVVFSEGEVQVRGRTGIGDDTTTEKPEFEDLGELRQAMRKMLFSSRVIPHGSSLLDFDWALSEEGVFGRCRAVLPQDFRPTASRNRWSNQAGGAQLYVPVHIPIQTGRGNWLLHTDRTWHTRPRASRRRSSLAADDSAAFTTVPH